MRIAPILTLAGLLLAGCGVTVTRSAQGDPVLSEAVTYLGVTYPVRRVADEPTPSIDPADLMHLPDGGMAVPPDAPMIATGPAIRISNVAARATATDAVAEYCSQRGGDQRPGWRDVAVRFDPETGDHVLYTDC